MRFQVAFDDFCYYSRVIESQRLQYNVYREDYKKMLCYKNIVIEQGPTIPKMSLLSLHRMNQK